jgi:hypothetical protein
MIEHETHNILTPEGRAIAVSVECDRDYDTYAVKVSGELLRGATSADRARVIAAVGIAMIRAARGAKR